MRKMNMSETSQSKPEDIYRVKIIRGTQLRTRKSVFLHNKLLSDFMMAFL
jgi:hypothetical protein